MPKFDVAVLGAGMVGLSVAARVAQSEKTVVLTDPSGLSGGAIAPFEMDGFMFTAGPNATYGFEPGGGLREIFSLVSEEQKETIRPARYQVVLPDRRITVAADRQETLDELRREFPREIDRLADLYREAEKMSRKIASSRLSSYVAARRSARSFLDKFRFTPELLSFFAVQAHYYFGEGLSSLPLHRFVLLLSAPPAQFTSGHHQLAGLIVSRLKELSATILWNEQWPLLQSRGRKAEGIKVAQGLIEARKVFINAPLGNSEQALFLGLREDVVPVRMEETVLCVTDYAAPNMYYALSLAPRGECAPAGQRALSAVFPVSGEPSTREELLDKLQLVIPFLREFTTVAAVRDCSARSYTIPDALSPKICSPLAVTSIPGRKSFRNVFLSPDSSRTLFPSLLAARTIASRLI